MQPGILLHSREPPSLLGTRPRLTRCARARALLGVRSVVQLPHGQRAVLCVWICRGGALPEQARGCRIETLLQASCMPLQARGSAPHSLMG